MDLPIVAHALKKIRQEIKKTKNLVVLIRMRQPIGRVSSLSFLCEKSYLRLLLSHPKKNGRKRSF